MWRAFDWPGEGEALHEVGPPLLGDREQGRVAWLVLIEVVHHDTDKQLQTEVHAHKDK